MTEDELLMRFELSRQSIASWSAAMIHYVRAATEQRETGNASLEIALEAQRMLASVREEAASLSAAGLATPTSSDDMKRGIAKALEELASIDGHLCKALAEIS